MGRRLVDAGSVAHELLPAVRSRRWDVIASRMAAFVRFPVEVPDGAIDILNLLDYSAPGTELDTE